QRMNISHATLFPGVDGYSRNLRHRIGYLLTGEFFDFNQTLTRYALRDPGAHTGAQLLASLPDRDRVSDCVSRLARYLSWPESYRHRPLNRWPETRVGASRCPR